MGDEVNCVLNNWFVYIIQSEADDSLYVGISNDVNKRLAKHNNGTGAKRTKGRGPWVLVWTSEPLTNRSEASKLEYSTKKLNKLKKLELIKNGQS